MLEQARQLYTAFWIELLDLVDQWKIVDVVNLTTRHSIKFYKVDHCLLFDKMQQCGMHSPTIRWVYRWLANYSIPNMGSLTVLYQHGGVRRDTSKPIVQHLHERQIV